MEFCENLIYKKKAIDNLSQIIKQNQCKKILFLAGKTAYQHFGTTVTNQLAQVDCEFVLKLINSNANSQNLTECIEFGKNCDFVITLGAGSVCDIGKLVSTKLDIPNVIIPSLPTTIAYFTNYAFLYENSCYKKHKTKPALKILVDENFIVKADKKFVTEGQKFVLSHFETLFSCQFDNLFYNTNTDLSNLKLQLSKFKDNYEYLQSDTDDSKLVLMDILIELSKCFENFEYTNVYSFAFCLKGNKDTSFSSLCLITSKILSNIYLNIFSMKNFYILSMPNFERLEQNLQTLQISKNAVNFLPVKKMLNNHSIIKVNSIKNQVFSLCEGLTKNMCEYYLPPNKMQLDLSNFYKAFNVVPVVYKCSPLINLIYGVGLMNF